MFEEYRERHEIDPGQVQSLFFREGPGAIAVELLPIPVTDSYVKIAHLLGSDLLKSEWLQQPASRSRYSGHLAPQDSTGPWPRVRHTPGVPEASSG